MIHSIFQCDVPLVRCVHLMYYVHIFFFHLWFSPYFLDEEALQTVLEKCWDTDNKIPQFALYCTEPTTKHVYKISFATSFAITYFVGCVFFFLLLLSRHVLLFTHFVFGISWVLFHFHTITIIIHYLILLAFCKSHSISLVLLCCFGFGFCFFFFFSFLSKTVFCDAILWCALANGFSRKKCVCTSFTKIIMHANEAHLGRLERATTYHEDNDDEIAQNYF